MELAKTATDIIPAISVGPFTATPTGLIIDESQAIPYEAWYEYGKGLKRVHGAIQWVIGDWLRFGERKYGEMYAQALELWPEYSYQSMADMVWVGDKFEFSERSENLGWSMHRIAASLPDCGEVIQKAEAEDWTCAELRKVVAEANKPKTPPLPEGKYRCIVVDPPWPVSKIEREARPRQGHDLDYPTMSLEEIGALDVASLADPNGCHLYLWTTQKYLPDALDIASGWGFGYQCLMTWVKPTGMTPYSWMYNTEHVIFAHVGDLRLAQLGLKLSFEAPIAGHSVKPDVFYDRVARASPGPHLEMFARRQRAGWQVWGNEV